MLLSLNGIYHLAGWQWLFLCEGVPAVILSIVVLFYLTENPAAAKWLTAAERESIVTELLAERAGRPSRGTSIVAAISNPVVWLLGVTFLLAAVGFYGYSFWSPLIIKSLTGTSDFKVGLISAGVSAATIVIMLLNSAHSDRTGERTFHVAAALLLMAVGFLGCALLKSPLLIIVMLALVPIGHCASYGPFWSIPSRFLEGEAAAAGTAMVVTIANVGGFAGPALIGYLKDRAGSYVPAFLLLGSGSIVSAILALQLRKALPRS
jgi:ACS family tartrate transporter-like MFS transporter